MILIQQVLHQSYLEDLLKHKEVPSPYHQISDSWIWNGAQREFVYPTNSQEEMLIPLAGGSISEGIVLVCRLETMWQPVGMGKNMNEFAHFL